MFSCATEAQQFCGMIYYLHATGREDPNTVSFALIA
jgi:hypothetical protein